MISLEDLLGIADSTSPELEPHDNWDLELGFDLAEVDRRLVTFALADIEDVVNSRKGKRRVDAEPTDEEIAFALFAQELEDRQVAYSLAAALEGDADLLAQIEQEERRAERDHELAQALYRGEPLPASGAASPARPTPRSPDRSSTQTPRRSGLQTSSWSGAQTPVRSGVRTPSTTFLRTAISRRPLGTNRSISTLLPSDPQM